MDKDVKGLIYQLPQPGVIPELVATITNWEVTITPGFAEMESVIGPDGLSYKRQEKTGLNEASGTFSGHAEIDARLWSGRHFLKLFVDGKPYFKGILDITFIERDEIEGKRYFRATFSGENQFQL